MKKFLVIFVVTFLLSALSLSAQYDLPNIISAKRVTNSEYLHFVEINKRGEYLLAKEKFDYSSRNVSLLDGIDSNQVWMQPVNSYVSKSKILDMEGEEAFLLASGDTVYKMSYDGNIISQIIVPSTSVILFKGGGFYFVVEHTFTVTCARIFIYNEQLQYIKTIDTDKGGIEHLVYDNGHLYVTSDHYGGGVRTNSSTDLTKISMSDGSVIWNYHTPDATYNSVIKNGNKIFFALTKVKEFFPNCVLSYGELNPETGDTAWTKEYVVPNTPNGRNTVTWTRGLISCGDGFVVVGSVTDVTQTPAVTGTSSWDENYTWPTLIFIAPNGDIRWTASVAAKGSFETGEMNSKTELMVYGNYNGKGYIYLFNVPGVTAVEKIELGVPDDFSLEQNYPNPFNPSTTIKFSIQTATPVSLKVYDLLGKEVASLVDEELPSGNYSVDFNANNLASGTYFYRLFNLTKKMVLLK